MVYKNVKLRSDYDLMRDAFAGLCAAVRLKKIQANMHNYYLLKFQKKVIKALRNVTERNNKKRLNLIR